MSCLSIRPPIPTVEISALFLAALEFDERLDFFLRGSTEGAELLQNRIRPARFLEKVANAQIEALQDLEQSIEANFVLALFHAREVGLVNADLFGKLHLGQLALTPELSDFASYEFELCWSVHAGFVDTLCYRTINFVNFNMRVADRRVKPTARITTTSATLHLLRELIKRDFQSRFAGSALGLTWAVLHPLSLLILYWFVFTFMIPGGRLGFGDAGGDHPYLYFLIAGLLPWIGFNEGLIRSTTTIVENSALVRRLVLRRELLVVVPNVSAMIFEAVGLVLFVGYLAVTRESLHGIWILPIALVLQFLLQLGIGFVLAALYVMFRDLMHVIGFLLSVLFYLSPILYSVNGRFEKFFFWNPLTPLFGLFRSALLDSPLPEASSIVFLLIVTTAALASGLLFFGRVQPALADLI
jgi:ABC-2 type transport system permease protein